MMRSLFDTLYIAWIIGSKDILDALKNKSSRLNILIMLVMVLFFYWLNFLRPFDKDVSVVVYDEGNSSLMNDRITIGEGATYSFRETASLSEMETKMANQHLGVVLPADLDHGTWLHESMISLDLGLVNGAEKCAYEALEIMGELPAALEHLALIHVVKGQPETARIFLNALGRNPRHRGTANEMLRRLDDGTLDDDPRVRRARSVALGRDNAFDPKEQTLEGVLRGLLARNAKNRMAFEFLMAHYLGIRRPDMVAANLRRLSDLGYREIPRHYQEAIVVYAGVTGRQPRLGKYRLSSEVLRAAKQFAEIRASAASPEEAVGRALAAGLGDTYFFYFTYRASGASLPAPRAGGGRT